MKRRWLLIIIIAANMLVLLGLVFVYPHLMVSPGALMPGHAALTTDCFACHKPLHGASKERCLTCHALADIGLRTTKGVPINPVSSLPSSRPKVPFHQKLTEQNCMACHSDHANPKLTGHSRKAFSHALLRPETRERCDTCHAAPGNEMHRKLDPAISCSQCHRSGAWKPASFDHANLPATVLGRCETCHKPPADTLHQQIAGNCAQCHAPKAWKPATFDHAKYFVLDKDHNASCTTCHTTTDYRQYTCYGCHEHTPSNISRKHIREGIRNFENCVKCHRSANEREGEGENGEGEKQRGEHD